MPDYSKNIKTLLETHGSADETMRGYITAIKHSVSLREGKKNILKKVWHFLSSLINLYFLYTIKLDLSHQETFVTIITDQGLYIIDEQIFFEWALKAEEPSPEEISALAISHYTFSEMTRFKVTSSFSSSKLSFSNKSSRVQLKVEERHFIFNQLLPELKTVAKTAYST
jgi:hypothetical protein